ncbi:hypothetical protein DDE82_007105 [Stemphylium lycopersici]|uniref:Uncharacterized protein n=1 Tax=Stemphylium lycopersici TaxID=183478 RepID=A0A364MUA3_STELY|nr:hypothetical protein TW65_95133 [Stemphylium lycopersici]RAR00631.1 hypothetical protein DDE82_007105 [Stemphylium lycopersici]RAR02995.1 hypothetical protein DDE83_008368 [Stemphylium lycopersici]
MTYADAETQTVWAGLTKMDLRPDILFTAPDTTTPPAEMILEKHHQGIDNIVVAAQLGALDPHNTSFPSLLERRKNRPDFPTRISLPKSDLDDEVFPSPPPTHAALSPLPEANKRFAGHTPLIPRARSPVPDEEEPALPEKPPFVDEEEQTGTPLEDQPLIGPLMLPTNPVDGAADHIALDVLDDVLEMVAKDQDRFSKLKDAPEPTPASAPPPAHVHAAAAEKTEDDLPLSRNTSTDSRKSPNNVEFVDGIILKTPPLNFGVPIGQV